MNYQKFLSNYYQTFLKNNDLLIPFFEGHAGLGKTQLIKDFCKNNNLELFILNLSAMDSIDLTGLPTIDKENNTTKHLKPDFFNMKKGILFLDELNRINNEDIKAALLSLFQDRKINGHELSSEVAIITAGNPCNDDDYTTNQLDKAFSDRISVIPFTPKNDDFLTYLNNKHEKSSFLDFINISINELREKYSFRRIEKTLNYMELSNDIESLNFLLSPSIYSLFIEYISKNIYSFADLKKGKIDLKTIDSSLEKKLIFDFCNALKDSKTFNKTESKNINDFLVNARAENKISFFEFMKNFSMTDTFKENKENYQKTEIFKNMKELLEIFLS